MPIKDDSKLAVIDTAVFEEIRDMLEDEFCELVQEYQEDAERYIGELFVAADSMNLKAINEVSHAFASASGHMGFMRLHSLLKNMEMSARQQQQEDYQAMVCLIKEQYGEVIRQLQD